MGFPCTKNVLEQNQDNSRFLDSKRLHTDQNSFWCSTRVLVFGCWELGVESRDFSQDEKERTACKAVQIHKKTTIFTQNDNLGSF